MTGYDSGAEHVLVGHGSWSLCGVLCRGIKPERPARVCGRCLLIQKLSGMTRSDRGRVGKWNWITPPSARMQNNTGKILESVLRCPR